jgi:catechol-2,3-dioxygenase
VVWLAARVPLLADPLGATTFAFPTWDADSVYCYDAAGNILELIARRTLQAPEARLFDAQSLLTISEVGLVTPDVDATIAWVQAQLPAPEYRSTRSPDFAALGDEHGLLIVAQTGREWYPSTGKRAVPAPLTIIASAGGGAPVTLVGPPWGEA